MKDLPLKAGMGFMIHGIVYQVVSVRKNGSAMIKPRFQATRALRNPTMTIKKPWWKIWTRKPKYQRPPGKWTDHGAG